MTDGRPELVGVPTAYRVRHIMARRKTSEVHYVCEESVQRVPSWSETQAPLIAHADVVYPGLHQRYVDEVDELIAPRIERVAYRAARMGDGRVRMVARLDSAAWLWNPEGHLGNPGGLPAHSHVPLFQAPSPASTLRSQIHRLVAMDALQGRIVLNSERALGLEHARTLAAGKLVLVDGVLHAACHEPGWAVLPTREYRDGLWKNSISEAQVCSDFMDCGRDRGAYKYLPFCRNPREVVAQEYPHERFEHRAEPGAGILEVVAGALGGDHLWRGFRQCCIEAVHNDKLLVERLFDTELSQRRRLVTALADWPVERNAALLADVVSYTGIIHGLKPSGNADMMARLRGKAQAMQANAAPMGLESRLEIAGVVLDGLPQADVQDGMGARGFAA